MVNEKAREIRIKGKNNLAFVLVHGYTGSVSDFGNLPSLLNKQFKAEVIVPRLSGHGTRVEDLLNYGLEDFIKNIEGTIKELKKKKKKVFLIGFSFGAQVALILSSKFKFAGLALINTPYKLKFPFSLPNFERIEIVKKFWKKILSKEELISRRNSFYYPTFPTIGLSIVKKANKNIKNHLKNEIFPPVLLIHAKHDKTALSMGSEQIYKKINSEKKKIIYFSMQDHNVFHSSAGNKVFYTIKDFIIKEINKK